VVAELSEREVTVSYGTVWQFFASEGIRFKKACTPASQIALTRGPDCVGGLVKAN